MIVSDDGLGITSIRRTKTRCKTIRFGLSYAPLGEKAADANRRLAALYRITP
jgi:hypothetical protein